MDARATELNVTEQGREPLKTKTDGMMQSHRGGEGRGERAGVFSVDVLELISLFVLLVWALGTQCVLSQLSQRHIKRVNLTSLSGVQKMSSHEPATKYFK